VSLPERPAGGVLRGDIDGDGRRDRASIRFAPRARASCGFFLVVETGNRTLSVRVPEWYKPPLDLPVSQWTSAEPFIALIVRLDARRSQLVVARERGASVVNVSLYGIVRGELELLRFPAFPGDKLSLFGSAGTGYTNARCGWGGPLIVLGRAPTSATWERWVFARHDYRLAGDRFVATRSRTAFVPQEQVGSEPRRWGFDGPPFKGCVVARGRRL
jgi:hypothetical protein